jgi:hypothetical protein
MISDVTYRLGEEQPTNHMCHGKDQRWMPYKNKLINNEPVEAVHNTYTSELVLLPYTFYTGFR